MCLVFVPINTIPQMFFQNKTPNQISDKPFKPLAKAITIWGFKTNKIWRLSIDHLYECSFNIR